MPSPLSVAIMGKGIFPMVVRGAAIINRYGLTSVKIDRALGQLSNTLKQFGCQATIPITALALSRSPKIAHKYHAQGLELTIHGLSHVDYRQLSAEAQLDHIKRAQRIFEQAGMPAKGFRSPYLRWNGGTLAALKACGFSYDSSQALDLGVVTGRETDSYRRVLDFYKAQCVSQYPALPRQEAGLVRIPYCLPDDEALVERLKITDVQVMENLWLAMLERIYEAGELFTLGLHPERVPLCQKALEAVLRQARSLFPPVWITRLDEVVAWHTSLGLVSFHLQRESSERLHMKIQAPPEATILVRYLDVDAATESWSKCFRSVKTNEFTILNRRRPIIGLSPGSTPSLMTFLRNLGYLFEINTDPHTFSYYIDRTRFEPGDERSLLAELDRGDWPLVRIARWPGGARAALVVTGDVDAFSLWDYIGRMVNG